MPAYLVRLIKNRDLVGIFTAEDESDLEIVVDECTDVPGCEYLELPSGGIMWDGPARPVPLDAGDPNDDETEVEPFPWATASLTERWFYLAYGIDEAEWTPFAESEEDDPEPMLETKQMGPGQVVQLRKRRK